jgi:hypothetical protein
MALSVIASDGFRSGGSEDRGSRPTGSFRALNDLAVFSKVCGSTGMTPPRGLSTSAMRKNEIETLSGGDGLLPWRS